MTDTDRKLREHLRKESDESLFEGMELTDRIKQQIRQQAAAEGNGRRWEMKKSWIIGASGIAAAVMVFAAFPLLNQPGEPVPTERPVVSAPATDGGAAGSELSPLITTKAETLEEAKTLFGEYLRVPATLPEGYALTDIAIVGEQGASPRDVLITYTSGEKSVIFAATRMAGAYPQEMFTKTKVGENEAYIYEQPTLTELFWMAEGVQYSITGPLNGEEAVQAAESAQ
ncbi:DUF4367 domain-containing protein [Paenibacillus sp. PL2-23]|uniref:DUF4367 domain-containing protein n=1 Tax=Paenibacillus sp. PL2-23 TaxID=2100729 RepID=UPI0030F9BA1E